jgi:hypothetical protein
MESWKLYKQTIPGLGFAFYVDLGHEAKGNRWWWQDDEDEKDVWWMCGNPNPEYPFPLILSCELDYLVLTGRPFKVEEVGMYWTIHQDADTQEGASSVQEDGKEYQ